MIRNFLSVGIVFAICAFVGAQSSGSLAGPQRAELYKKNRLVIERLVDKTVESSKVSNDHVKRAGSYNQVLVEFSKAISDAKNAKDAERVKELTQHLNTLLDKGLAPTLTDAQRQAKGTHLEEYLQTRDVLLAQVTALLQIVETNAAAHSSLNATQARLIEKIGK